MCTTGHLQMTRYNVGQHHNRGKTTKRFALKWFARYDQTKYFSFFPDEKKVHKKFKVYIDINNH